MEERYWNMMTNCKFHLLYLGLHYHRNVVIERTINIILAVISTGALGALFLTETSLKIWVIILAITQIITAAKPYLPYSNRITDLDKGIALLDIIYKEIEREWEPISHNTYTSDEINSLYYVLLKKWDETDAKILENDSLPQRKKLIVEADLEKNHYFEVMFSGGDNENGI